MKNPDDDGDRARRLREVLAAHQENILRDWTASIREQRIGQGLSDTAIRDHLPLILSQITRLLDPNFRAEWARMSALGEAHAVDRLALGFNLDEVIVEYSTLRSVIVATWGRVIGNEITLPELSALDEALDESIRQAVVQYANTRERVLRGVNRVSEAAAHSTELAPFLQALLGATLESLPCDIAFILVRDGDLLKVQAVVGLDEEVAARFSLRVGEGFAGRVASLAQPITLHDAANDPLIRSPLIKARGVRVLHGVPLIQRGEVIGVGVIGSTTAADFAEENKLLFGAMASRAASFVAKTAVLEKLRRAERVQTVMSEVGERLIDAFDIETALANAARAVVPALADWCVIDLVDEGGLKRVAIAATNPREEAAARQYSGAYPVDLNGPSAIARAARAARTSLVREVSETDLVRIAGDAAHLQILRELGIRSYLVAPMLSRHRVVGTVTFANTANGRRFSAEDVHIAEEVARRMVMAVDSSRLYHEARAAVATRDQLLAVVSHDLRNHLSVITASTSILDETLSSKEAMAERTIGALKRASSGMTRLVADLLDSAAIRAGQLSLDVAEIDVDRVMRDLLEAHAPAARAAHVHLKADLAADGAKVAGDVHRLDQAIGNLLRNALRYCRAGDGVTLRTRAQASAVTIELADTGPGIPAELLPELFNPYERGVRGPGGTGLGLFIAKGVIERHGGTLEHKATDGGGATFCITLPRKVAG